MKTHARAWRAPLPWCASLLLALLTLLAACGGSSSATSGLTAQATATPTSSPSATVAPTASNTPRLTATATQPMRPAPSATSTPRPNPTATPRPPAPTPTPKPPTPTPTPPKPVIVTISGFAFSPKSLTIIAGTTVEWVNMDSVMHTTTSNSGDPASWNSGPLATNATFSFTFTTPGSYGYHCAIHPFMTATITVTV